LFLIKGACWSNKGDHKQSLEYYQKCFEMRRRLYGEDAIHSDIARVLNNIGAEYSKQKGELSIKEAISYCEIALEMQTKLYEKPDGKHPDLIETLENLSAYCSAILDEEKSLKYARQETLQSLGESYRKMNELDEAHEYCTRAYDMRRKIYENRPHEHLLESLRSLHTVYLQLKK
jgi:tetratricopeptide (TPR) repeat protein